MAGRKVEREGGGGGGGGGGGVVVARRRGQGARTHTLSTRLFSGFMN